jgi:hypothetical protein
VLLEAVVYALRVVIVVAGAALAGSLVVAVRSQWGQYDNGARAVFWSLFVYVVNMTVVTALILGDRDPTAASSLIYPGVLVSYALGYRAIYYKVNPAVFTGGTRHTER